MSIHDDLSIAGYPQLLHKRHENTLWARYTTILLGVLLLAGVPTFMQGGMAITISDCASALLLMLFGFASLKEERRWAPWAVCLVGIWLQLAPLLFWAPSPYTYLNNTLIGVFAVALSVLIPGSPGVVESGPEIPVGWSYNPSSWMQRIPVIGLAFLAWMITRYMAAYQLGYIHSIPDPLFGEGTRKVVSSATFISFPIPDAGLWAAVYTFETLMGCKGGSRRWHTMPWIVILFGLFVIPIGFISTMLALLEPITAGFWCSWCLLTAVLLLIMIAFTVDEVMATVQFLVEAKRSGKSFWSAFWKGSAFVGGHMDARTPLFDAPPRKLFVSMCWGVSPSWTLTLTTMIGIWLMFSPDYFIASNSVSMTNHILGALACALSVIAMAEVARVLRIANIIFGILIAWAPYFFADGNMISNWNNVIAGAALVLLSCPRGRVEQKYGNLDRFIR